MRSCLMRKTHQICTFQTLWQASIRNKEENWKHPCYAMHFCLADLLPHQLLINLAVLPVAHREAATQQNVENRQKRNEQVERSSLCTKHFCLAEQLLLISW